MLTPLSQSRIVRKPPHDRKTIISFLNLESHFPRWFDLVTVSLAPYITFSRSGKHLLSTCCKEWAWRPNIFSPAAVARILLWPKKKLKPDLRSMFQVDWFDKFLLDSTFEYAPVCAGIMRCRPCCAVSISVTTNLHDSVRAL